MVERSRVSSDITFSMSVFTLPSSCELDPKGTLDFLFVIWALFLVFGYKSIILMNIRELFQKFHQTVANALTFARIFRALAVGMST